MSGYGNALSRLWSRKRHFGYALGRVLVLEGRVMSRARLDRLAHAQGLAEQLKVLSETEYAHYVAHATDRDSLQEGIEGRVEAALALLEESRAGEVARFFRVARDFTNVKVAALGAASGTPYVSLGTVGPDAWRAGDLPEWLAREVETVEKVQTEDGEAAAAAYVDGRRLASRLDAAYRLGDPLTTDIAKLDVDMANARLVVRGAADGFLGGGLIAGEELSRSYAEGGPAGLALRITRGLPDADGVAALEADASGDWLEVVAARTLMALARLGRLRTTTNQPVVAWMASVEAEARLVSLVVLGGIDGVSPDVVRQRVAWAHG